MFFLPDPGCEKPVSAEDQSPTILTPSCVIHVCRALNQLRHSYDEQTSMGAWRKGRAQSEQLHTRIPICVQTRHRRDKALWSFPFLFPVVQTTHSAYLVTPPPVVKASNGVALCDPSAPWVLQAAVPAYGQLIRALHPICSVHSSLPWQQSGDAGVAI